MARIKKKPAKKKPKKKPRKAPQPVKPVGPSGFITDKTLAFDMVP